MMCILLSYIYLSMIVILIDITGSMILYLKWLQNVLLCSHRNDCWCCFHFQLRPNPILKVVVLVALPLFSCFVPFTPDGSKFVFTHFPITIESVSLFQSAILTKRSNSLLASCSCFAYTTTCISLLSSLTTN